MKKKIIKKLSGRPMLGSFYILGDAIYYSTIKHGIDHSKLWQIIVPKIFSNLVYENKKELMNAPYGVDRGRVTWTGDMDVNDNPSGKGQYVIYGTPGCEPFVDKIKSLLSLSGLPNEKIKTDFSTDSHYKIQKNDKAVFDDSYRLVKKTVKFETTHIANVKKGTDLYKKVVRAIESLGY